jgi:hypothetical protein
MTDIEGEIQKRLQRRAETDKRHLDYQRWTRWSAIRMTAAMPPRAFGWKL